MFGGTSVHWGGLGRTSYDYDFLNWPISKGFRSIYQTSVKILDIKIQILEKRK